VSPTLADGDASSTTAAIRRAIAAVVPTAAGRRPVALAFGRVLEILEAWRRRYHYRRELERLMRSGPHLIEDIGLIRRHAERDVAKPFWRR
jgi:uncharacterized protein YjiS (DUF1127 family)